jgi:hypothetical protein
MKIKITESQLKRIIEKYTENDVLNEAWYDDALDFVKSSYKTAKDKTKEVFKGLTGIDFDKKDDIKIDEVPTNKEIKNKIEDIKKDVKITKDKEEKDTEEKKDEKKTKTESGGTTVVIGGISYATANWMKSQWENAGLSTKNVEFINYNEGSKLEKLKDTKNVTKIMGFSAGGRLIWKEIDNNVNDYDFIGLIDPSSSKVYSKLPSNVKSLSNSGNWGGYPSIKSVLAAMEKNGTLTKTSKAHRDIPLEFFKKHKNSLD